MRRFVVLAALLAQACASHSALAIDRMPAGYAHGGDPRDVATINMIVIHTLGGPDCRNDQVVFDDFKGSAVYWRDWFARQTDKSIHYIVDRDGRIAQQRPEDRTAGHVSPEAAPEVNKRSIGIEIANRGDGIEPFPEVQVAAVIALVQDIAARRHLGPDAIRAHSELDTRILQCAGKPYARKVDPGPLFPMARLKAAIR
jgi:hypothetical protein